MESGEIRDWTSYSAIIRIETGTDSMGVCTIFELSVHSPRFNGSTSISRYIFNRLSVVYQDLQDLSHARVF